jgi:hypothetical protein
MDARWADAIALQVEWVVEWYAGSIEALTLNKIDMIVWQ